MARKKQSRVQKHFRVSTETPHKLNKIVISLGFTYGDSAAVGEFLDAIADGKLIVTKASE